jgi:hypothetical protein
LSTVGMQPTSAYKSLTKDLDFFLRDTRVSFTALFPER